MYRKKCVFINLIDSILIQKIITNLKEKSEIIETNFDLYQEDNFQKNNIKEEIDNFCFNFISEIKVNNFVKDTIYPLAGYIIRIFFYPTYFFEDPSFFIFDENNNNLYEIQIRKKN